MLEFENEMFIDILQEDGLLVAAKGLGIEQVFLNLMKSYCDPGNLVLVLGTSNKEEEFFINHLDSEGVKPLPRVISSDFGAPEREIIYKEGGVLFISSRILVVDLLKERVPISLVTGILVYKAHRILESCQEAFAIRLYRQKNKVGFIKACSSNPGSFTVGFARVDRIMRTLFVRNLYLWPRFHATVRSSLQKHKPNLVELHLQMTPGMLQIQTAVLDLISFTVKELKRVNPTLDTDELTVENAISKSFHKILQLQLDPIWHQLSHKTKQLVSDLKTLRTVLSYLTQYDCVTFYTYVQSLKSAEYAMKSSGWVVLDAAETMFVQAENRVLGSSGSPEKEKPKSSKEERGNKADTDTTGLKLEVNPKWLALTEVLSEIQEQEKTKEDSCVAARVLILAEDSRICNQLAEVLSQGSRSVLLQLYNKVAGTKADSKSALEETKLRRPLRKKGKNDTKSGTDQTLTQLAKNVDQKTEKYPNVDASKEENGDSNEGIQFVKSPVILFQPLKGEDPCSLLQTLKDHQPSYVVIYDADMAAVRQLEVYSSSYPDINLKVFFLMYQGSVEEQAYLTTLRREKEAFEFLIKEKASMVVPKDREGREDDHPDLVRDVRKPSETANPNLATRRGGVSSEEPSRQMIIVDMREFRSELPGLIHYRGIDIEPVTLQIGDYILTPEICVERKSISDLIGSLNSGRLYYQAKAMTRHYEKPMLLIEFDQNKPFSMQGYYISNDVTTTNLLGKVQLLTMHFPQLRIVWSPSPYATAELFEELKQGKEQPDVDKAAAVGADIPLDTENEEYYSKVHDLVSKLPGVNSKNVRVLINKVESLDALLCQTKEELGKLLENSINGNDLWEALHNPLRPTETSATADARLNKKERKRGFRNKGKQDKTEKPVKLGETSRQTSNNS